MIDYLIGAGALALGYLSLWALVRTIRVLIRINEMWKAMDGSEEKNRTPFVTWDMQPKIIRDHHNRLHDIVNDARMDIYHLEGRIKKLEEAEKQRWGES